MKKLIQALVNYVRKEWFLVMMVIAITVIILAFEVFV